MNTEPKGRFWWGAIRTTAQARQILYWSGGVFIGIGAILILSLLASPGAGSVGARAGTAVVLIGASAWAMGLKNRLAAGTILLMAAGVLAGVSAGPIALFARGQWVGGFEASAVALFWLLLTVLAWRGFRAAWAYTRLYRQEATGQNSVDVFT